MSRNEQPLVRLERVVRVYSSPAGDFRAVDDVSLELPRGEFVAVVGRSGSGKSTLMNLIAGLDRATSGEIHVDGRPIHSLSEDQLAEWRGRSVGVVFQSFQLLPTLSVAENVALPMDFCGTRSPAEARQRSLELLDAMGVLDQADKLPLALSGGQQQRVALARALANDPTLLVADEPTGNLDRATAERMLDLMRGLTSSGRSVLVVTHDPSISERADRVVSLSDGRIGGEHA